MLNRDGLWRAMSRWSRPLDPGDGTLTWFWYWLALVVAITLIDIFEFGQSVANGIALGVVTATLWLLLGSSGGSRNGRNRD
jgi:hypothetical protein